MNCIIAGLVGGVGAFFADYFMWGKVFTKGMEQYSTPVPPEQMKQVMAKNLPNSCGCPRSRSRRSAAACGTTKFAPCIAPRCGAGSCG